MVYKFQTIELGSDNEGANTATLIQFKKELSDRAILYIHGFSDYFFQDHLAEFFTDKAKVDFYALDLRKHGRSILPHQTPNHIDCIERYFEELDIALLSIFDKGYTEVYLMGHSTGGLICTYYDLHGKFKNKLSGMILNSPFFDFNLPYYARLFLPFVSWVGSKFPMIKIPFAQKNVYGISLNKDYYGNWDFDQRYKPIEGFPARAGWINAIYRAQKELQNNPQINTPILVMHSTQSYRLKRYSELAHFADIVLDIGDIERIGVQLGANVTMCPIENAKHDIFLSTEKTIKDAELNILAWLEVIKENIKKD